ncbi:MAG: M3 family metallopeptidase [Myxococcota bacterium]
MRSVNGPRRALKLGTATLLLGATVGAAGACGPRTTVAATTVPAPAPGVATAAVSRGSPEQEEQPPPGPTVTAVEPLPRGMSVAGVEALCDENLDLARDLVAAIKALGLEPSSPAALSWAGTMGRFDDVHLAIYNASELPYLMGVTHPDRAVREAAQSCETKTDALMTSLYLDDALARVLQAYAAQKPVLTPERQRFVAHTLRDFRRNGIALSSGERETLRTYNQELTELGQKFIAEIGASRRVIRVGPRQLQGLPDKYVTSHPPGPDGMIDIATDYPDFQPFVKYARDRDAARNLYVAFTNRGGDVNVRRLERILQLRADKARLLGYRSWADYAIEPRMAGDAASVRAFLDRVSSAITPAVVSELAEFRAAFDALGNRGRPLLPPDRYYLTEHLKNTRYALDTKDLARYFDVSRVTDGLLALTGDMYGLSFERRPGAPTWHPTVSAYRVKEAATGREIGGFYLDLEPRENKYKHAAMFTIRTPKRLVDGTRQTPLAALVCNFPPPGQPMSHDQVVTYFHEFGHVLHHLLTETELAVFAGTNTVRDFVETPSQMFEEWAWDRAVLNRFARHQERGTPIDPALFDKMVAARRVGLALATERQLYLARLDLDYHASPPGFDTTERLERIHRQYFSFDYVTGTHFQSSFGHLIGYDAGYYGYQWALSLSYDVLARFKRSGLLHRPTARAWRSDVLRRGGSQDPRAMLEAFLGRPPDERAYLAFLRGDG